MKIMITKYFRAFGAAFEGIEEGQVHEVTKVDKKNGDVWIMGNGEEIRLLGGLHDGTTRGSEFKIIEV